MAEEEGDGDDGRGEATAELGGGLVNGDSRRSPVSGGERLGTCWVFEGVW